MLRYLLSILLYCSIVFNIQGQSLNEIKQFKSVFDVHQQADHYGSYLKNSNNELQFVMSLLFVSYKEFISSQDGDHCVFYPSCSVYAIQAVRKEGLFLGLMNGIDRLSRCNRLSPKQYTLYKKTNLFYDPLD